MTGGMYVSLDFSKLRIIQQYLLTLKVFTFSVNNGIYVEISILETSHQHTKVYVQQYLLWELLHWQKPQNNLNLDHMDCS